MPTSVGHLLNKMNLPNKILQSFFKFHNKSEIFDKTLNKISKVYKNVKTFVKLKQTHFIA